MAGSLQTLGGIISSVGGGSVSSVAAGNGYGILATATTNAWADRVTVRATVPSGSATIDATLYRKSGTSYVPMGTTATATFSGSNIQLDLLFGTRRLWQAGETYAIVIRVLSGTVSIRDLKTRSVSAFPAVTGTLGTGAVPDPWTPANTTTPPGDADPQQIAIQGYTNVVPTAAITSPAANASSNVVPTFTVTMTDSDIAEFGDALRTAWLHIVGDSSGTPTLSVVRYAPTATAIANANGVATGSVTPAISLPVGVHWVRMAASDRFGATSAFTAWQKLTITASAHIEGTGVTPAAKIEAIQTGFQVLYTNPAGFNAASVYLELYQGTTRIRKSASIAVSWAPNTTQTVSWAQLVAAGIDGGGTWGDLQWGQTYDYQLVVTDTNGTPSPPSVRRSFKTDTAPGIPSTIAPKGGINVTSRPVYRVLVTDIDDTNATGLTVTIRHKSSTGTLLFTRTATYYATISPGVYEYRYQTTATDIPDPGAGTRVNYRWDASAFDGTLYSGQTTVSGSRAWSTEETFGYTQGPAVSVTSPVDGATITTGNPTIRVAWAGGSATQAGFTLHNANNPVPFITYWNPIGTYTSPIDFYVGGNYFYEGQSYDFFGHAIVAGVQGDSDAVTVTLDYPAFPAPLNFTATPYTMDGAPWPTLIQLSWSPTTYSTGQFVKYLVTARPEGAGEFSLEERTVADISDPNSTMCFDGFPASGVQYRYTLRQVVTFGNNTIPSDPSEQTAGVEIKGVVLSVANDPTNGVVLVFDGDLPEWGTVGQEDYRTPFGSTVGVTWSRPTRYRTVSASFPLRNDPAHPLPATELKNRAEALSTRILCWRDRDGEVVFFRIPAGSFKAQRVPGRNWDVSLSGREESWLQIPAGLEGAA